MGTAIEEALVAALQERGLEIVAKSELDFYRNLHPAALLFNVLSQNERELISPYLAYSKSQLAQDLFALAFCKTTSPKYFVEFGATDGISLSNTWLLEKKLGWSGILAEPAKTWHNQLKANRNCIIDTMCVARNSGYKLQFLEVNNVNGGGAELSGIKEFASNGDWASEIRLSNSKEYEVETISLNDLLDKHNAPNDIQFLSLDTEGSEIEILEGYNFENRTIRSICVEHNYVEINRKAINALLLEKGYAKVLEGVSKWDDWYVLKQN
jgi:FkbM family methyltransferase